MFNKQVVLGERDETKEKEGLKEKEGKYRSEIVGVWEREQKISDIKNKLERDLGVAINDDKIKLLMSKT